MRALLGGLLAWCACQARAAEPKPACEPKVHKTTGPITKTLFEQYRFVGATADGKRVAVERANIGPGSGVPILALSVLEAGAKKSVKHASFFVHDGTADKMPELLEGALREHGDVVTGADVPLGKNLPTPIPWCADAQGRIHAGGQTLELKVSHEPCPSQPGARMLTWKLCRTNGGCFDIGFGECLDGTAKLLDLYRAGRYTWAVVDEIVQPFEGVDLHQVAITGREL